MLRENTNVVQIRDKVLGGKNPILIQTMAKTKTSNIEKILELDDDLHKRGADLFRVSVLDEDDLIALKTITKKSLLPIVADIHFSSFFAIEAINNGADKIRLNPGNFKYEELVEVIKHAKNHGTVIRLGINSGSLDRKRTLDPNDLSNYFKILDRFLNVFKEQNYTENLVLALKSSDPLDTIKLNQAAAELYPYPIHLGITESGFGVQGMARSAAGLVPLLLQGIGNTIRISLSDKEQEEIEACKTLLKSLHLNEDYPTLIACPTCGRTRADVSGMVRKVKELLAYNNKDIKVAIMGCPVNGPGEAASADLGLAGTVDHFLAFKEGIPLNIMTEEEAYNWLKENIETFPRKRHILK